MKKDGGPVSPIPSGSNITTTGMSIRDYFAGLAMQSYVAHIEDTNYTFEQIAQRSYAMADEMLVEKEKNS